MNLALKERLSRGPSIVNDLHRIAPSYDDIETPPVEAPNHHIANLAKLEADLNRNPLDEIATAIRALTYGEMMELAEAIWKTKPESDITQDALPMMLHKWSGSRG